MVAKEDDAPTALQSEYSMREVVLAAAIQGAIFAATKAADRPGRRPRVHQADRRLARRLTEDPERLHGRTGRPRHPTSGSAMAGTRQRESAVDRIRERVEEKAARRAAAAKAAAERTGARPGRAARRRAQRRRSCPGIHAEKPTEIPWRGWKQILKRAWAENKADNMPIIGGGVAFFGFLAIFPALIALISLYGLVASPETVARQVEDLSAQLPASRRRSSSRAAERDRRQQRRRAHLQPDRLDPRRAVERVGRRRQPDHRGQHRLRRGGDPQLRQAQADCRWR